MSGEGSRDLPRESRPSFKCMKMPDDLLSLFVDRLRQEQRSKDTDELFYRSLELFIGEDGESDDT